LWNSQLHGATRHIHTLELTLLPSNKNTVSHPQVAQYRLRFNCFR